MRKTPSLMPKAFFSLSLLAASIGSSIAATDSPQPVRKPQRPNIVLIISDDHAQSALGVNGHDKLVSLPGFNRLAQSGMVFDNSFCCNSICGPSRAAIYTGRHSHRNAYLANGYNPFDGSQPTMPKLLQKNGYQTAVIGKWHLESDPTGFDFWQVLPGQGSYYNPDFICMDGKRVRKSGYASEVITQMAKDWLATRDMEKPFFLVIGHKAPHRPWAPNIKHLGKIDAAKLPLPPTLFDDYDKRQPLKQNEMSIARHLHWNYDLKIQTWRLPQELLPQKGLNNKLGELDRMSPQQRQAWDAFYAKRTDELRQMLESGNCSDKQLTEWKWRAYMHDYLATLLGLDEAVADLEAHLQHKNLRDNTLIIYCGDQSFYLGEHGMYDKRWMFEPSMRMPLIMSWPKHINANTRSAALVQNIDYAATLCDIAGIKPDGMGFQGRSLWPIMQNSGATPPNWREGLYYAYYEWRGEHNVPRHDGVRSSDGKKIIYFPREKQWMLFDLVKDPEEMHNLAQDPAAAELLQRMQQLYYRQRNEYKVPDGLPGSGEQVPKLKPSWQ